MLGSVDQCPPETTTEMDPSTSPPSTTDPPVFTFSTIDNSEMHPSVSPPNTTEKTIYRDPSSISQQKSSRNTSYKVSFFRGSGSSSSSSDTTTSEGSTNPQEKPLPQDGRKKPRHIAEFMPDALEKSFETGTVRRVNDYMDLLKLWKLEVSWKDLLSQRKELQLNVSMTDKEKCLELQEYLKQFNLFLEQKEKTQAAMAENHAHNLQVIHDLDVTIQVMNKKLEPLKKKRDVFINKVSKYEKLDYLITRTITTSDTQFLDFQSFMDRHNTLINTSSHLLHRFTNSEHYQYSLLVELKAANDLRRHQRHECIKKIKSLETEFDRIVRENFELERKCYKWANKASERIVTYYNIRTSIKNMAFMLMKERPSTRFKLLTLHNPCDLIQIIGTYVLEYNKITNHIKRTIRRRTRTSRIAASVVLTHREILFTATDKTSASNAS